MIDNTMLLRKLFAEKLIALENAAFLASSPSPMPVDFDFDRIEGMLLGLAVGDSLGNTSESMNPVTRYDLYGEIRDYLPNNHANSSAIGLPSDDTQMSFWTLEQLLDDGGLVPVNLADRFSRQIIYGMGSTVREFLRAYKDRHKHWYEAGQASAGNGALMRIAPILLPHLKQPSPALWSDAAIAGMLTHNDRASNTCCVAFTHVLWECLRLKETPEPLWWIDTFWQQPVSSRGGRCINRGVKIYRTPDPCGSLPTNRYGRHWRMTCRCWKPVTAGIPGLTCWRP